MFNVVLLEEFISRNNSSFISNYSYFWFSLERPLFTQKPRHRIYLNLNENVGCLQSLSYLQSWQNPSIAGRHIFLCELCKDVRDFGVFKFFLRLWKLPEGIYCSFTNLKLRLLSVCQVHHNFLLVLILTYDTEWNREQFLPKTVYSRTVQPAVAILQAKVHHLVWRCSFSMQHLQI